MSGLGTALEISIGSDQLKVEACRGIGFLHSWASLKWSSQGSVRALPRAFGQYLRNLLLGTGEMLGGGAIPKVAWAWDQMFE